MLFSSIRLALVAAALAAGGAIAQTASPFGGFKHDSTAPIEITSDSLEVQQANNLAIFAGSVVAGQGTLRLTADRVAVTYTQEKADSETGAIRNMRADGNVFLSNGAETATGSWAEYDVAGGVVRMGGAVVLTQGGNAISGESLTIDLNSGTGRIDGQGKGRVKSVFTPSQNN
ncbi:lipopolysaccharide transport periplasmic protein LptA [Limibaculum sp. FT325]|uniref:lipopolysaccharide transport periplasmic protein LptA n=1 Tax=Thermohalobaculum sediminis TaxID=2939436 RepID=UPI0020BEDBE4|nr:lipopolysaccharide transport periplasmic protein LptA [Limibaculum sediminis]MCL5776681.1 lipopolysaccharide transport periplasmic protein LptA [Limibaculum sediminis]